MKSREVMERKIKEAMEQMKTLNLDFGRECCERKTLVGEFVKLNLLPVPVHMYLSCLSWHTQYLAVCSNDSCFTCVPSLANRTA